MRKKQKRKRKRKQFFNHFLQCIWLKRKNIYLASFSPLYFYGKMIVDGLFIIMKNKFFFLTFFVKETNKKSEKKNIFPKLYISHNPNKQTLRPRCHILQPKSHQKKVVHSLTFFRSMLIFIKENKSLLSIRALTTSF